MRSTGQRNSLEWTGTCHLHSLFAGVSGAPSMTLSPLLCLSPTSDHFPSSAVVVGGRWRTGAALTVPTRLPNQVTTAIDSDEIGFGLEDVATGRQLSFGPKYKAQPNTRTHFGRQQRQTLELFTSSGFHFTVQ